MTDLGTWTPTAEEIVAFAREWDPQPFHLDEEAARQGPFGGLVASGWHGICVWGRLYVDAVHGRAASMGGGAMEDIRFLKPIRPGRWPSTRRSGCWRRPRRRSRPERGTSYWRGTFVDDEGDEVLVLHGRAFFRRRG